jgi:hypothetical protein
MQFGDPRTPCLASAPTFTMCRFLSLEAEHYWYEAQAWARDAQRAQASVPVRGERQESDVNLVPVSVQVQGERRESDVGLVLVWAQVLAWGEHQALGVDWALASVWVSVLAMGSGVRRESALVSVLAQVLVSALAQVERPEWDVE